MEIQNTLWKLHALGDSSVTETSTREAVKEVARVISELCSLCNLGAGEDLAAIAVAVRQVTSAAVGDAFAAEKIVATVAALSERSVALGDELSHHDSQESVGPLYTERRIIRGALSAAQAEYGAAYFDARHKAMGQLSKPELDRLYKNFEDYRDNYCAGAAKLNVPDFLKEYGLTNGYTKVGA